MANYFQTPGWVGNLISVAGNYRTQEMVAEYNAAIAEADRLSNEAINTARNQSNEEIARSNREVQKEIAEMNNANALQVAGINAISNMTRTFIPILWNDSNSNGSNSTIKFTGGTGATESASKAEQAFDEAFPTLKDSTSFGEKVKQSVTDTFDKVRSTNLLNLPGPALMTLADAATAAGALAGALISVL